MKLLLALCAVALCGCASHRPCPRLLQGHGAPTTPPVMESYEYVDVESGVRYLWVNTGSWQ